MALLKFAGELTVKLAAQNPRKTFVFGDNLERKGMAGQAVIRKIPNAVGVATKIAPSMETGSFFRDVDLNLFIRLVLDDLERVGRIAANRDVVVPVNEGGHITLGLGLAGLPVNSPTTHKLIVTYLNSLAVMHGGWGKLS